MVWVNLRKQIQPYWSQWQGILMAGPGVAVILLLLRGLGLLQPLEWATYDRFLLLRPESPRDDRILIVGVTETDLERWGSPFSDETLATLLETLEDADPRAIGLDFYRNLPVEPGHDRLVELFETSDRIIGIEKQVPDQQGGRIGPPPVLAERGLVGVNDVPVDGDGRLRRALLFLTDDEGNSRPSLGFLLAWMYLQQERQFDPEAQVHPQYLQLGRRVFYPFEANDGGYVRADAGGYQILLNFRGGPGSFEMVSLAEVLDGEVSPERIRDRVVLIGPLAPSLNDFFYTPYSQNLWGGLLEGPDRMSGVEFQAHLTSQVISAALDDRPLIRVWPSLWEAVWILVWTSVAAVLYWRLRQSRGGLLVLVGGWILLGLLGYGAFLWAWWIPVTVPMLGLGGGAIVMTNYVARLEREDRQLMMHLFGRHVTSTVAEEIWRQRHELLREGRLPGRRATATVLFTDIKNFSTLAEQIDAEPLMRWLNEYMEEMAEVVLHHEGAIDKFIGDSVMAVFGVPLLREEEQEIARDAIAAVRCALDMAETLRQLNGRWQKQGQPIISMRVGIATGPVVVGSLGSSQREDYTIIGDSVNVAARLESFDKSVEGGLCRILMSESTYRYVQGQFPVELLGNVLLKGRQKPAKIYQVRSEPAVSEED
ncbi:MAG: adenylate/guanylate cyclase domain-containing protein [Phormidium sp. BM_Day4_Bin.17]|nr:adenylate/guanylate cyclase domain-containing protein [Phormidium sp. BM_Day4_Bin.17]UCJ12790.1 MAG: adenylate/guanylate cyclase domain-containing protein [Phormidium sp. PBR-2020]